VEALGQGTSIAGRYQLVDPLTSDVAGVEKWLATDRVLERDVQVHLLREGRTAPALDAARRAALIKDERLIRIIDAGEQDGVVYVITAQPEGKSLFDLVLHEQFLPADQARAIVGEAAEAIEAARRRGVYHLVLRPTTIYRTDEGKVLLTGLGLEGALLSLDTAPPLVTARTDAMGLVANLYYALTGRWPSTLPPGVHIADLEQAPVVAGSPAPPAELSAGIPNDLDTLCTVTFGPNNDGPHSASEVARELAPWPEISTVDPLIMADENLPPDVAPAPPTAPSAPQRESFRDRLEAPPVPTGPQRTTVGVRPSNAPRFTQGTGRGAPAAFPGPAPLAAASAGAGKTSGTSQKSQKPPFNPTPWVLGVVAITVIIAVVLAFQTLSAPLTPREPAATPPPAPVEPTESATESAEPEEPEESEDEDESDSKEPLTPVYIDSVEEVDPDGDGQHPEQQHLAIDGDSDTYWNSQWFVDPAIPGRSGIGLAVTLEETSEISQVRVNIDGEGGQIEIRDTDNEDPGGGDLLADGAADGDTVFEFDSVELDTFVIWVTELPVDSQGNNRISIAEISVK